MRIIENVTLNLWSSLAISPWRTSGISSTGSSSFFFFNGWGNILKLMFNFNRAGKILWNPTFIWFWKYNYYDDFDVFWLELFVKNYRTFDNILTFQLSQATKLFLVWSKKWIFYFLFVLVSIYVIYQ